MRPYVLPVIVRTAVLGALPTAFWGLGFVIESDPDFRWLIAQTMTMALVPAVWAVVDGALSARRGDPVHLGLLMWLVVAAGTGLLQFALFFGQDLVVGQPLDSYIVSARIRPALFYAGLVAAVGALMFGLGWLAGRRAGSHPRV